MNGFWVTLGAGAGVVFLIVLVVIVTGVLHVRRRGAAAELQQLLALGLPPGSIRGLLALVLVGAFVVVVVAGIVLLAYDDKLTDDNKQFYLSVVAPLGTLAAAAAAFYFGTKSVQVAASGMARHATPSLSLANTDVRRAPSGAKCDITIHGLGFTEHTRFALRSEGKSKSASMITIHSSQVATAQFDLDQVSPGLWDLLALGPGDEEHALRNWFTVEQSSQ